MESQLQKRHAHGEKKVYPMSFHKTMMLYRSKYEPPPQQHNPNPNQNQNQDQDQNKTEDSKEKEDKQDGNNDGDKPTLGAHFKTENKADDDVPLGPAAAFLLEHKDMENVGWEDDSIDDSDDSSDDEDGAICAVFPAYVNNNVDPRDFTSTRKDFPEGVVMRVDDGGDAIENA